MKTILGIFVIVLVVVVLLIFVARPEIPKVSGAPDYEAGTGCLHEIPRRYEPGFFTLKGWIKAWYARYASKWGIGMSPDLLSYYNRYVQLQLDVDCYVNSTNDRSLNMTLSPTEFKAAYNAIAKTHGLEEIR